jgi:3-oxoacyl-[acyl-carrier-protein] synthase-3
MILSKFDNFKIVGISAAVPSEKIDITSFIDIFGEENVLKFIEMTGVKSVHRACPEQTAGDLGYEAALQVLEKTGADPSEIGVLIFVTQKPDYRVPSTAFVLHKRLNLPKTCSAFDLNLACSGFIYGMQLILSMLKQSDSKKALLVTGDTSVRTISPMDRSMIMLFGDSGSATFIEKNQDMNPAWFSLRTDGKRFKSIITPAGAYRNLNLPKERTVWGDGIIRSDYDTHMKGMDVFGFSITDVPKLIKEFMEHLNTSIDSYDYFALHQANIYILKQISRKIKIPEEKLLISLDHFGNNSSNSIPLLLADHFGKVKEGKIRTLMSGFGAGLSWACADITLDVSSIFPLIYTDSFYTEGRKV